MAHFIKTNVKTYHISIIAMVVKYYSAKKHSSKSNQTRSLSIEISEVLLYFLFISKYYIHLHSSAISRKTRIRIIVISGITVQFKLNPFRNKSQSPKRSWWCELWLGRRELLTMQCDLIVSYAQVISFLTTNCCLMEKE